VYSREYEKPPLTEPQNALGKKATWQSSGPKVIGNKRTPTSFEKKQATDEKTNRQTNTNKQIDSIIA